MRRILGVHRSLSKEQDADTRECRYKKGTKRRARQTELCPACKIFGAMGYQGQLSFQDAALETGNMSLKFISPQFSPTADAHRRIYPHDVRDTRSGNWPVEVADAESAFDMAIKFQNLAEGELGLVLSAMGCTNPPIRIKLGAGKNSGLGSIKFADVSAVTLDLSSSYFDYSTEDKWTLVDIPACIEAAKVRPAYIENKFHEHPFLIQTVLEDDLP